MAELFTMVLLLSKMITMMKMSKHLLWAKTKQAFLKLDQVFPPPCDVSISIGQHR